MPARPGREWPAAPWRPSLQHPLEPGHDRGYDLRRRTGVEYQAGVIQRGRDVKILRRRSDPLDDFPAGVRRREEQVPPARDAQKGSASPRQRLKVVEAVPREPAPLEVPPHPLTEHQRALVVPAEAQRPRGKASERERQGAEPERTDVPLEPHSARARRSQGDERIPSRSCSRPGERGETDDATRGMSDHPQRAGADVRAKPLDQRRGVALDEVVEPPAPGCRFALRDAMAAEVGEPNVEPVVGELCREAPQPDGVTGERTVQEEQDRGDGGRDRLEMMEAHRDTVGGLDQLRDHPYRPENAYASSSTSTGWRTGVGTRRAASPAPICMMQPGLPVTTRSGEASRSPSTFTAKTSFDSPGSVTVYMPALPQHFSASRARITVTPEICRSTCSGASLTR